MIYESKVGQCTREKDSEKNRHPNNDTSHGRSTKFMLMVRTKNSSLTSINRLHSQLLANPMGTKKRNKSRGKKKNSKESEKCISKNSNKRQIGMERNNRRW